MSGSKHWTNYDIELKTLQIRANTIVIITQDSCVQSPCSAITIIEPCRSEIRLWNMSINLLVFTPIDRDKPDITWISSVQWLWLFWSIPPDIWEWYESMERALIGFTLLTPWHETHHDTQSQPDGWSRSALYSSALSSRLGQSGQERQVTLRPVARLSVY